MWAAIQYMGSKYIHSFLVLFLVLSSPHIPCSGYLASCHNIVTCACKIENAITVSIPSLYVLGSPPASVIVFALCDKNMDALEVSDVMRKRGWHLTTVTEPKGIHITCTVRVPFIHHHTPTEVEPWQLMINVEAHPVCHGHFYEGS